MIFKATQVRGSVSVLTVLNAALIYAPDIPSMGLGSSSMTGLIWGHVSGEELMLDEIHSSIQQIISECPSQVGHMFLVSSAVPETPALAP